MFMSSCGSYEASGAYTGSMFGNMLGSAIGGIAGGWRGHEIGSLIGTVGGAAAGAAIGAAADKSQERKYEARRAEQQRQTHAQARVQVQERAQYDGYGQEQYADESGFDPEGRGDDRITIMPEGGSNNGNAYGGHLGRGYTNGPALVIRHAGVFEKERDGVLTRGEKCEVVFEIMNNSDNPVYDVYPLVEETTGNKHIHISPNLRVESIAPHKAIRYTAILLADNKLRDGQIEVKVGVAQGNTVLTSQTRLFAVPTSKRANQATQAQ